MNLATIINHCIIKLPKSYSSLLSENYLTINKNVMKKTSFILGIIGLIPFTPLVAQETETVIATERNLSRVEFGIKFMPTISTFDLQTSSGGTIKGEATLGYGAGASLGFNFTKHVGMQIEVIYNSLSQKYKDAELDREINVRYVNIPFLFSLNTNKIRPVNLSLVAGPQIGFNVGSSIKGGSSSTSDTLTAVLATKKSDVGFAYGIGLEFMLNEARNMRLDIGFRGVYGFANISETKPITSENAYYILDRATVRTKSGYIGITFLF